MAEPTLAPVETEAPACHPPVTVPLEVSARRSAEDAMDGFSLLRSMPEWRDWRWQMRHRIRSVSKLKQLLKGLPDAASLTRVAERFPIAITPYYASLIRTPDLTDPVFQMGVPQIQELFDPHFLKDDPLEEEEDMCAPGLIHRYQDRALLIATTTCAMYCRHCTRKRRAGVKESCISPTDLKQCLRYLSDHPEIHDVIVSGGDPFSMGTDALDRILSGLRSVPSVDVIRIGTRTPVTMPMRVTESLTLMLRRYHPIWVNTHFNHPNELTPDSAEACERLADAGIPLGNQSVLLAGINDHPQTMERLCRGLIRMRVRPYYLFQCDLVRGVEHFRTRLSRGIEIMEYLRGRVSGTAIPTFVVDAPHGGGKIPVLPNYLVSMSPTHTVLRNFEGMLVSYPEPTEPGLPGEEARPYVNAPGVWELASGSGTKIAPAMSIRQHRRQARSEFACQTCDPS